jgi:endoglucanase Acf2
VELLIRDCDSPDRADPMFPFMRAFDIYAGHSWASGDAAFASGNNQESSSEAINFAAGTALWGMATGDTKMRDLGMFLYATESHSLMHYWFDIDGIVFPKDFGHTMLGMIWGEKADYATWFSAEPECIHGINMLPVTASSLFLGRNQQHVLNNYAEIVSNNGNRPVDQWHDIMWKYLALGDAKRALAELNRNPGYKPEAGDSLAHTYHWIHNIAAAGRVRLDITANTTCYAVFEREGQKTYVVYNPGEKPVNVVFSDGHRMAAPARTLTHSRGEKK